MLQAAQRPYLENRHAIPVRVCKKVLDTYIFEKATLPHWIRECTIFELSSMYIYVEDIFALDKGPGLRFRRPCGPMSPSMRSSTSYLRAKDYQLLCGRDELLSDSDEFSCLGTKSLLEKLCM